MSLQISNTPTMQNKENFSFGRRHEYTRAQKDLMKVLKRTAEAESLPDFYTGRIFCRDYPATIEHIVPFCMKKKGGIEGLQSINGLENFVPVGNRINSDRNKISLEKWYRMHPEYLLNGQKALELYEKVQAVGINGRMWVESVKKTLNSQLGYPAFTGNQK